MIFNGTNIMLDLETMGTKSNAAIVSIGAVIFNTNCIYNEFYRTVDLASSMSHGLTVDAGAIYFWLRQDSKAREVLTQGQSSLNNALRDFNDWLELNASEKIFVWGNGSDFDNVIISNAYAVTNIRQPWGFRNNRCYRTFRSTFADLLTPDDEVGYINKCNHNALEDAKYQALQLIDILKKLNK